MGWRLLRDTTLLAILLFAMMPLIPRVVGPLVANDHIPNVAGPLAPSVTFLRDHLRDLDAEAAHAELARLGFADSWRVATVEEAREAGVTGFDEKGIATVMNPVGLRGAIEAFASVPGQPYLLRAGPWTFGFPPNLQAFGMVLVLFVCFGLGGSLMLRWPDVRRVRDMEQAASLISRGQMGIRVTERGRDELRSLARHFNHMVGQLQAHLDDKQHLIYAIAHEYRTPLSTARFRLEMLQSAETEEERRRQADHVERALNELEALVSEVLEYARLGAPSSEALEDVLMPEAVNRVVEGLTPPPNVRVTVDASTPVKVAGDARHLRRLVENLLTNAFRHARSEVVVSVGTTEGERYLEVADDGPGVPEEDRARIFQPFARRETDRGRDTGGSGLGLAIVQRIAHSSGGVVEVSESAQRGALFTVRWPIEVRAEETV
ncbi:MAG: ATP-binding protein [Myxococcota bacterium]